MKAREKLEIIKDSLEDEPSLVLLLDDNLILQKFIILFEKSQINFDANADVSDDCTLAELWRLTKIDAQNFCDLLNIGEKKFFSLFTLARDANLIFPDGSVNALIRRYLREVAIKKFPYASKKVEG